MTAHWWSPDRIVVRRGAKPPLLVLVVRRHTRRRRRIAARMAAAGQPACWIAGALGISRAAVAEFLKPQPFLLIARGRS